MTSRLGPHGAADFLLRPPDLTSAHGLCRGASAAIGGAAQASGLGSHSTMVTDPPKPVSALMQEQQIWELHHAPPLLVSLVLRQVT